MRVLNEVVFPFVEDTNINHDIFSDGVDRLISKVVIDKSYTIPYLAGYSKDEKIIYIDKHFPLEVEYDNKKVNIEKAIVLHEIMEKDIEDKQGLIYQEAHQFALRLELDYVKDILKLPLDIYNEHCDKYIKTANDEKLENIPIDLDLRPYEDEEDYLKIKQMQIVQNSEENNLMNEQYSFMEICRNFIVLHPENPVKFSTINDYVKFEVLKYCMDDLLVVVVAALVVYFKRNIVFDVSMTSNVNKRIFDLYNNGDLESVFN